MMNFGVCGVGRENPVSQFRQFIIHNSKFIILPEGIFGWLGAR